MSTPARVRLREDPGRIGILTGREETRRGRKLLQVMYPDFTSWVPEDQLEPLPEERQSPLDLLQGGRLGGVVDLRRTLAHVRLTGRLADIIYSMEATNTDFYAYQFKPVLKLLQSPTNGILVADEVGLGKTIEAGLIWTELRSRFDMRRLVVLCPAALREKWRAELADRMGVDAEICDARRALERIQDQGRSNRDFALVCSTQGLRPDRNWEDPENTQPAAALSRYLRSHESDERLIDLVVIDEAHHLRNPTTQSHELGQLFRNVSEYVVLLTATPVHNRNQDLFSLLQLLDPGTFARPEDFPNILSANAPLVQARDRVLTESINAATLREILIRAMQHPLLQGNRQLGQLLSDFSNSSTVWNHETRSRVAYRLETVNLLGHAVTRTRKRDVKEWRIIRDPTPEFIPLSEVEARFYQMVTETVAQYATKRNVNERFLLATPQRMMASCMPAALRWWQSRSSAESESEFADDAEEHAKTSVGPITAALIAQVGTAFTADELEASDSKYQRLAEMLRRFFMEHPREKVIIFSTFRATLAYLDRRLAAEGFSRITLQGGQARSKAEIVEEFRKTDGPQLLLSSEVGGEGIDLQFSRWLINYDLPWNPMRVEQRIGRIDRLGQQAQVVQIWNLFYADTIDERIYRKLYEKLDLCRYSLGDFEVILGDEIRKLTADLLTPGLTKEQQEHRIEQTAQALENLRREEEHLETEAAHLVAYGDYILQQIKTARDLNRWISGEDIFAYVQDFVRLSYPGCHFRKIDEHRPIYEVSLTPQLKEELATFIKKERLAASTSLTRAASSVRCLFENRVIGGTRRNEEVISQFHPLVRFVSARISESATQLRPAVSVSLDHAKVPGAPSPGIYVLAASLWSVSGVQPVEKLVFAGARLREPIELLESDATERLAMAAAAVGTDWVEAKHSVDLDAARCIANEYLFDLLDARYTTYVSEIRAQNEDRADLQSRTLERHFDQQRQKLEAIQAAHLAAGRTSLAKATEGRLRTLMERVERKRSAIKRQQQLVHRSEEIAILLLRVL